MGAVDVAVGSVVTATFSESLQAGTVQMSLTPAGGSAVAATVAYNDATRTATLTPSTPLTTSTVYSVAVSGAKDAAGNTMAPVDWSFTTVAGDTSAPTVTGRSPGVGAVDVAVGSVVAATFSESLQAGTVQMSLTPAGGSPIAATVVYNDADRTATLTPSTPLTTNIQYDVAVAGAKDAAGNTMAPVDWSFTTVAGDMSAPAVTLRSPGVGAVDVAVGVGGDGDVQ